MSWDQVFTPVVIAAGVSALVSGFIAWYGGERKIQIESIT
ncbi:hypothetical protein MTYM_02128 [Methylococcales bacterium]|nr:hypothetical protein MTYM_02128 [Methylococcales bacterium]